MKPIVLALTMSAVFATAHAQITTGLDPLEPEQVRFDMGFGSAVGISGDTAVVGAARLDGHGAAYVFTRSGSTWTRTAKLLPPDLNAPGAFGAKLAFDGTLLVTDSERHQVFYFVFDGGKWRPRAILKGGAAGFAAALAMEGCAAVVTSDGSAAVRTVGFVHVFNRCSRADGNWEYIKSFSGPDTRPGDRFGASIALSGSQLLVGAPGAPQGGAVYYYTYQNHNWIFRQKFVASNQQPGDDYFGTEVALRDTLALVGAPLSRGSFESPTAGVVFSFNRTSSGWVQTGELRPPVLGESSGFGARMRVLADRALISAPNFYGQEFPYGGMIYIYRRAGTSLEFESRITGATPGIEGGEGLGVDFATSGDRIIVGAPRADAAVVPGVAGVVAFPH